MPDKVPYRKEHIHLAYYELWKASRDLHEMAKKEIMGQNSLLLSSFVTLAFSYEAYLNHLGKIYLKNWKYLERRTWKEKTNMISEEFSLTLANDWGTPPLQSIDKLFKVRDRVAHGRTVPLSDAGEIGASKLQSKFDEELKPNWFQIATDFTEVSRIRADVERVMQILNDARPYENEPLFYSGLTVWKHG